MFKNVFAQGLLQIIILGTILFRGMNYLKFRSSNLWHSIFNWSLGMDKRDRQALFYFLPCFCSPSTFQRNQCKKVKIRWVKCFWKLFQQSSLHCDFTSNNSNPNFMHWIRRTIDKDSSINLSWAFNLYWNWIIIDMGRSYL